MPLGGVGSSNYPTVSSKPSQEATEDWSKAEDPAAKATAFFTSTDGSKQAQTGLAAAKKFGLFSTSYSRQNPELQTQIDSLVEENLAPEDFAKELKTLVRAATPKPGLQQLNLAKLQNLEALKDSGDLDDDEFATQVQKLQVSFMAELQVDAGLDAACGLSALDSFDPQSKSAEYMKALKGV